jgi:hypothetical protein
VPHRRLAAVLLVALAAAGCGSGDDPADVAARSPIRSAAAPSSADVTTPASTSAGTHADDSPNELWFEGGGQDALQAVAEAVSAVVFARATDAATVTAACQRMQDTVAAAQALPPFPDPALWGDVTGYLDRFAPLAADCLSRAAGDPAGAVDAAGDVANSFFPAYFAAYQAIQLASLD